MPPPKKVQEEGQPLPEVVVAVSSKELAATMRSSDEICRFISIGCLYRLRKLPSQPLLPERIILERRTSHLHEKEEWDVEWRQQ